jgi:hypothetical protein
MVVDDFDIPRISIMPAEADTPLVVDSNAMLAGPVAAEFLKAIARRDPEIVERLGGVDGDQLAEHDPAELRQEPAYGLAVEQTLRVAVREALDHPE